MPGQRQGNPQLGFEICPHTCGCIITQSAANRSRRRPTWMKWAPIALKDGHHLTNHIKTKEVHPNCSAVCSKFQTPPRDLTLEEWTAWAPHLGHYTPFVTHIPSRYHNLIPSSPQEENYNGVLPNHPLRTTLSLQHEMSSMSIQSTSQHPSSQSTSVGPSPRFTSHHPLDSTSTSPSNYSSTSQINLGPNPSFIFVEAPRVSRSNPCLESVKDLLCYGRYLVPRENWKIFIKPLRSAPKGLAFQEPAGKDDKHQDVLSFLIHDMASIYR
jgi:hypothetical protein